MRNTTANAKKRRRKWAEAIQEGCRVECQVAWVACQVAWVACQVAWVECQVESTLPCLHRCLEAREEMEARVECLEALTPACLQACSRAKEVVAVACQLVLIQACLRTWQAAWAAKEVVACLVAAVAACLSLMTRVQQWRSLAIEHCWSRR